MRTRNGQNVERAHLNYGLHQCAGKGKKYIYRSEQSKANKKFLAISKERKKATLNNNNKMDDK